jgi:hypothetical protein
MQLASTAPAPGRHLIHADLGKDSMPVVRAGAILRIDHNTSVQFTEPFLFQVIRELDCLTYDGWTWYEGYQLDAEGNPVEKRQIFIRLSLVKVIAGAGSA